MSTSRLKPKDEEAALKKEALAAAIESQVEVQFTSLLSLYPDWPSLLREAGMFYGRINKFELALKFLQKAAGLNRTSIMALRELAIIYRKMGDGSTADALSAKAHRLHVKKRADNKKRKRQQALKNKGKGRK